MAAGNPSRDYVYVLLPEDTPALHDEKTAKRHVKKQWAAQEPAERTGYFIAKIEFYLEPVYDIKATETRIEDIG